MRRVGSFGFRCLSPALYSSLLPSQSFATLSPKCPLNFLNIIFLPLPLFHPLLFCQKHLSFTPTPLVFALFTLSTLPDSLAIISPDRTIAPFQSESFSYLHFIYILVFKYWNLYFLNAQLLKLQIYIYILKNLWIYLTQDWYFRLYWIII